LIFVLFDQEEVGLVGSAAYADKLAADAVPVHSVHSIDQLGWDEDQDHLIELERGDPDIRQLYQNAVTALGIDVPLSATRTGSTDHESFRPRFKAIGVTEEYAGGDTSPHRHRITDTYDTLDLKYLETGTRVVIRVMSDLVGGKP
jgi:Zn-dependent M28 family amino/carboxypeptidase